MKDKKETLERRKALEALERLPVAELKAKVKDLTACVELPGSGLATALDTVLEATMEAERAQEEERRRELAAASGPALEGVENSGSKRWVEAFRNGNRPFSFISPPFSK